MSLIQHGAVPIPLTVILSSNTGISDFFPFHDLARLPTDSSPFSFRQFIESNLAGSQEILLFSAGCQTSSKVFDCSIACNDTTHFFGSLETFYNCAALASISYWTREDMVYYISEEAEKNASSIMGAGSLATFEDRFVLESFVGCAREACGGDGLNVPCDGVIESLHVKTSTAKEILDALDTFCPSIQAEINPDIFGPGVLISYILQVSFSVILYFSAKVFSIWIRFSEGSPKPSTPVTPKREHSWKPKPITRRIETMFWPDTSAQSRTSIAIATTLVEFQEAQCWFVFAVQIASILAIVVNSQEGTFWGEIIVNAAVAYHVSQNGVLPMFLIQICLHNEGIRNWHTFLGFFAEYLLAIIATSQKVRFEDAFELFKGQSNLPACGGNPSPRTYCAAIGAIDDTQISFFPHPLLYKMIFLVLDTIAIFVLLVDQLAWTLRKHRRTQHVHIGSYRVGRGPVGRFKKPWAKFKRWFWRVLEIIYVVVNILYMVSLIKVINAETFATNRWSYGQIIAVTVWGPVIVKLFDLILSGPPKNGMSMNSGPPRLRIDNVINLRLGTSIDEVDEDMRKRVAPSIQLSRIEKTMSGRIDVEGGREGTPQGMLIEDTNELRTDKHNEIQ